ncbi:MULTISPECIES: TetR/AcrR family transcriptional regulator [unclassified Bacillus (in: firmicutes)]|uniref:TetR/AcrR family transcriptional regulator n=1 Tax=unclassified Bacillus (in: firmicutes) TaxID=185979 RepID=UPI001BECD9A0|nr:MULTISPECIES: TetR/AcrR family transcriptional regulator [unclassified Bacillus (in: firmicutes)]MBT2619005.1 TetR/AcrR family transcriptional regulator [Bacillus sp. ISL-78]MBT2632592.1 TetR/AcrR family transcriptional regulator [Bacillus sp. ISL-101]
MTKREQIIEVAKLLFRTIGYHDTSVQDILDQSGVSKGTFYNHFPSKSQLIQCIIQEVDAKVEEQQSQLLLEGDPHSKQTFYSQLRIKHSIYSTERIAELYNISMAENDEVLRKYMADSHYKELNWLAKRLIEVYGIGIEASAMDLSTHFIGGLGYQFRYSNQMKLDTNSSDILDYNILRLEKNIEITKQSKHILFPFSIQSSVETLETVVMNIKNLLDEVKNDIDSQDEKELIDFILEECQNSCIRWSLCEGAVRQLKILSPSPSIKKQKFREVFNIVYKQARKYNNG